MNISFIVIARNEEVNIGKCLSSIASLSMLDIEVICVDSASFDNTVNIMLSWKNHINCLKIFKIVGDVNASIARNVGIRESSGDIVYFVDSDVEITEDFLAEAVRILKNKEIGAVVGQLTEYQYSNNYKKIIKMVDDRNRIPEEAYRMIMGGIFITKRCVVNDVGEFDEAFTYHEDTDYSLRISSKYKIIGLPVIMGIHHTIPRHQKNRMLEWVRDEYGIYVGNVFKKNIKNKRGLIKLISNEKGILSGFALYCLMLFFLMIFTAKVVFVISLFVVIADFIQAKSRKKNIPHVFLTRYVMPLYFILGLMHFKYEEKKYHVEVVL